MTRTEEQLKEEALNVIQSKQRATLNARDGANYLGLSYWKFLEEIKAGRIPHFRIGNRVLCRKISLDVWMAAKEAASVINEDSQGGYGKLRTLKA